MPVDASNAAPPASPAVRRKLKSALIALLAGIALLAAITRGLTGAARSEVAAIRVAGEPIDAASLALWIPSIPASENGALRVLELIDGTRKVDNTQVPRRARSWDAGKLSWAMAERARVQSWRSNLHTALGATRFRYPINVTNGVANLGASHLADFKHGVGNLAFWATTSALLKQPEESAEALLDGLRLARTLDDEPVLISWLVRTTALAMTAIAAENSLTLSPLPDAQLAELQAAFLAADRPDPLTRSLLTERALGFEACMASPSQYVQLTLAPPGAAGTTTREWAAAQAAQAAYQLSGAQGSDAEYFLKTLRELIEISRLKGPARFNALLTLQNRFNKESDRWNRQRSRTFAAALFEPVKRDQRIATILRSAAVACAIERFRNAHQGQLPSSLDELVPAYLPSIPLDPATDQPLRVRFQPFHPGYVVYGLGPDGEDNQGNAIRAIGAGDDGTDITFIVER